METAILEHQGIRIAVEGCGHGTLDAIYATIEASCRSKGWDGVDLVIIGGDFQAVRNHMDLNVVSMPKKYRQLGDFSQYYFGKKTAPYLTIFIGGNHEASNYLWELYYGGWVAPNIYYMGAANVVRLGPLRIAGLSGIWKGYDYNKPHHERLPYNDDEIKSIYHVRELDVRKLLQVRGQVDIGLSHDWPRGMEKLGNHEQLFRLKPFFRDESAAGTLGSLAAMYVLEKLRPAFWFSAHLHAKYAAVWKHTNLSEEDDMPERDMNIVGNPDEIDLDDLDMEEEDSTDQTATPSTCWPLKTTTNRETHFLALDKCMPGKRFLQLLKVQPLHPAPFQRPLKLEYDKEWLAITRVFAAEMSPLEPAPKDKGHHHYRRLIDEEMKWVEDNLMKTGKMTIPEDFVATVSEFDIYKFPGRLEDAHPHEATNPHTQNFCNLIQIKNPFDAPEEERAARRLEGPKPGNKPGKERGEGRPRGGQAWAPYPGADRGRGIGVGRGRGARNGRGGRNTRGGFNAPGGFNPTLGHHPAGGFNIAARPYPAGGINPTAGPYPAGGYNPAAGHPAGGFPGSYPTPVGGFTATSFPVSTGGYPAVSYTAPAGGYPVTSYMAPVAGHPATNSAVSTGGHPTTSYTAPTGGYPVSSYAAPTAGHPTASYTAPAGSYPTPAGGYPAPTGGYPTTSHPDRGNNPIDNPASDSDDSYYNGEYV